MGEERFQIKNILAQFLRFAAVGSLGVLIDFGLLNILSWVTGITKGWGIVPLNIISFSAALAVSFFLNKHWTFKDNSLSDNFKKFNLFLIISLLGLTINTSVVALITSYIHPSFAVGPYMLLNLAKIMATAASGLWNFSGYKLIVFKK
jgi:putative flippase GtrA